MISTNNCTSNNTNLGHGIKLDNCSDIIISGNDCYGCHYGIFLQESTSCSISNNTCSDNKYGYSLWRDTKNCDLRNNTSDSNIEYGVWLDESDGNEIIGNAVVGNRVGIHCTKSSENNTAHKNKIFQNTNYGINAEGNNGRSINATSTWWGSYLGPYHIGTNPGGKGNQITDHVTYDPWLLVPPGYFLPQAEIISIEPGIVLTGEDVHFTGNGSVFHKISVFSWRSNIDGIIYNGSSPSFSLSNLSNGSHIIYLKVQDNIGYWSYEITKDLIVNGIPTAMIVDDQPEPFLISDSVTFNANGTDDNQITRYVWTSSLDGELYNGTNNSFSIEPTNEFFEGFESGELDYPTGGYFGYYPWDVTKGYHYEGEYSALSHQKDNFATSWMEMSFEGPGVLDFYWTIGGGDEEEVFTVLLDGTGVENLTGETPWTRSFISIPGGTHKVRWIMDIGGETQKNQEGALDAVHFTPQLSLGTHTITLRVQDNYGVWSENSSMEITVHEKPVASIDGIAPNPADAGQEVTFSGSATDDGYFTAWEWKSSIDGVLSSDMDQDYIRYLDQYGNLVPSPGDEDQVIVFADYQELPMTRYNRQEVDGGTWELKEDAVSIEGTVMVNLWYRDKDEGYDNQPVFKFILLRGGEQIAEDEIQVNVDADSPFLVSGNLNIPASILSAPDAPLSLNIRYTGWEDCDILLGGDQTASNISFTGKPLNPTLSDLSEGEHTITFRVQDDHGVWSEKSSATLIISENQKPTVIVTSHKNHSTVWGTVTISGTAADLDGNIVQVELALDVQDEWEVADGTDSWSHTRDTAEYGMGKHTIFIRAYDGHKYSDVISMEFTITDKDPNDEGSGGFLPGFALLAVIGALGISFIIIQKNGKRGSTL